MLEVRGVTKAFGERQVLRGVDLTVNEHEAVALIGASGSGKSTLLRCIDLLEEIDDGDIFLDGEVITDPSVEPVAVRRRLGLVFQAYNLFPHLTALQNVVLGEMRAHGRPAPEAEERGRALLRPLRPRGPRGRPARQPLRRPAAARRDRPRLLRAAAGAAARRGDQRPRPRAGRRGAGGGARPEAEGMTMVIATHEMSFAREVADEVAFLHDGRIVEQGPPERVLSSPRREETKRFLSRLLEAGRA